MSDISKDLKEIFDGCLEDFKNSYEKKVHEKYGNMQLDFSTEGFIGTGQLTDTYYYFCIDTSVQLEGRYIYFGEE